MYTEVLKSYLTLGFATPNPNLIERWRFEFRKISGISWAKKPETYEVTTCVYTVVAKGRGNFVINTKFDPFPKGKLAVSVLPYLNDH
ncbi:hypothetical protein NIES19_23890 [Anabaena cylindrica PCC 7122]|nr:hypothetical protein NIES19_23890 [Anabaena cylindrica PCC 7122]